MADFPLLSMLIALPLLGVAAIAVLPRSRERLAKPIALVTSLLVFAGTVAMWFGWSTDGQRFQYTEAYRWIPQFGSEFAVGIDGIAAVMVALIGLLVPVVVLASWHDADGPEPKHSVRTEQPKRSVRTFFALLLVLESCMIGVFAATDILLFYVCFEFMLVPMYFLINSYGGPRRQYAAVKFFLYSLVGGLFMLAAVIGLYAVGSDQLGVGTFSFQQLTTIEIDPVTQRWLFAGFFIAFAIKAPLVPFHTWLPDAGGQAPVGVAVLLVGVLDKVGTFGMLRYCLPLFGDAAREFAPWIIGLAVAGVIYGAILAVGQSDMKRLVAYTSIAHFGFIALGIFAFTAQAGTGAVLYMLNHGLSTGALFLVVGFLISRRGSSLISDYGGMAQLTPWIAGTFLIAGLSSLALPGTNSFVSEFLVLIGTFGEYEVATIVATVGIVFAALYVLWLYQRTMHGALHPELVDTASPQRAAIRDITAREVAVIAPLIALILLLGVYPQPVIDVIEPAVEYTLADLNGKS
ncbi:MAG: NADH-quinone oxidoreductase subunit M [Mycobacteriales bacterium]